MIIYTNIILNITDIRHNISLFICYSMIYDFTYRHKTDIILTYYRHHNSLLVSRNAYNASPNGSEWTNET